ncbi:hypothetical protein P2Q70_12320, partial [Pseudomonas mendocina]|uniref:hypothetical protein n=1 Tax=Ectopseudomonas mendocina TaxID=300 RepID=UPI0023DB68C7
LKQTDSAEELRFDNSGVPVGGPASLLVLGDGTSYDGRVILSNVMAQVQGDQPSSAVEAGNAELVIDAATLILSGEHAYESVELRNSAVLTSPLQSAVKLHAGTIEVDASSRIDVSAKG